MKRLFKLSLIILSISFSTTSFANKSKTLIIGIAGGSGSGKTTMAKILGDNFKGKVTVVNQDSYYKDLSHMEFEDRFKQNFDHPDLIDFDLMQNDILKLKSGKNIEQPEYNFVTGCRENTTKTTKASEIIIVEGILIFAKKEIRDLLDLKVFINAKDDIRAFRRIKREIYEFNRDFHKVYDKYIAEVQPMYLKYVEPSKNYADMIVPNGGKNKMVLSLLTAKIKEVLKDTA